MNEAASWIDRSTRLFWKQIGRPVDLRAGEWWLDAPMSDGPTVGDSWLHEADARSGTVQDSGSEAGLLATMSDLDSPQFSASHLRHEIRDFYERTSAYRMEVWTQWKPVFAPGGELVSRFFGRRVQQLALPTRPLDVARGMDSTIVPIHDASGRQVAAGWMRTLRSTGDVVYSGCYSVRRLPGSDQPSVHFAFPLESGNVQVYLRPHVMPGGALRLTSTGRRFGSEGAYVVVREGDGTYAALAPLTETFDVYVDPDGILRTDHALRTWGATAVRLHYKLTRV